MKLFRCVPVLALLAPAIFLSGCNIAGSSSSTSGSGGSGNASASPSISVISPNTGPTTGGTAVNIKGSNFASGALIFFGAVAAAGVTVNGPTQIQAVAPSVSNTGAVSVVVQNSDGQSANLTNGFTYTSAPPSSAPTVSSVSPGTASPGTQVTVNGTNFGSGASVTVGSAAASNIQFLSSSQMTAIVPSLSPGTYDVSVANTNGLSATLSSAVTVPAPQSLLSGCTVDSSNQPSCAIPSGWTDVVNEGFEGGKLRNTGIESVSGGSIECTSAHSGSCAFGRLYNADDLASYWHLAQGAIGSSHEIYISFWENDGSGMQPNYIANNFVFTAMLNGNGPRWDRWAMTCDNGVGPGNLYLCQSENWVVEDFMTGAYKTKAFYGPNVPIAYNSWVQVEIHYKANTVTGGVANSDGSFEEYLNGKLILSAAGAVLNGAQDMTGMPLRVGSYYEINKTTDSTGTLCLKPASSGGKASNCWGSSCSPCPNMPNHTKYWDDIIVLRK